MMSLENMIAPDSIGVEKGLYLWNGSRHRVMNHLLALFCICVCIGIAACNGLDIYSEYDQPLVQLLLGVALFGGLFFAVRAIHDHRLLHVKHLAIVGDKGFSILKYSFFAPDKKFFQKLRYNRIPSHPQPLLRIRKPIMWADIEE